MNENRIKRIAKQIYKTAGEVRFVKDKSNDSNSWAYGNDYVEKREISGKFQYNKEKMEPLKVVLQHAMNALEDVSQAQNMFAKLKSVDISPDGCLGGKGYIAKIVDIRKQFMNIVEALSSICDTVHDEVTAQHWNPSDANGDDRQRGKMTEDEKDVQIEKNEDGQV